jgi:D-galacturonate reductase
VHKRLDPFYSDARDRALQLGDFNYLYAYMSQPKFQLETFRSWAGKSSDISYYLNSHHVDWSEWTLRALGARPVQVSAFASRGIASQILRDRPGIEDSITLNVTWINLKTQNVGIAIYTSSWAVPKSDVHSQQRFHYVSSGGEITVDQAHRGCTVTIDSDGFASVNPLFMKYEPRMVGGKKEFAGQGTYGVRSLENFVDACRAINAGMVSPSDFDDEHVHRSGSSTSTTCVGSSMATVHTTLQGTAILEAGRRSLDLGGRPVNILYDGGDDSLEPTGLEPHTYEE